MSKHHSSTAAPQPKSSIGQRLTAHYIDCCLEHGFSEMVPMKGHIARRAKELVDCGVSEAKVAAALSEFVRRRGRSALQLAEIHAELEREGGPVVERPSARRAAKAWIAEHGWPTGARWCRGQHSGTYAYDALGTDRLPSGYDWPYRRPSFDEVVEALAGVSRSMPAETRRPNLDDVEIERGLPVAEALGRVGREVSA